MEAIIQMLLMMLVQAKDNVRTYMLCINQYVHRIYNRKKISVCMMICYEMLRISLENYK